MKRLVILILVVLVATTAFADGKWGIGASFGTSSMVERTFNKNDVAKKAGTLGIGVDIRGDFQLVKDVYITGIFGWEMPDRTFIVKDILAVGDISETKQHYIHLGIGMSFGDLKIEKNDEKVDLVWSCTFAPTVYLNCCKGKFGIGGTGILKGSYMIGNNVSLDMLAKVAVVGIADSPVDDKTHLYTDMGIKLGATYSF